MQTLGCRLQVRGSAASWRGPAPQEGAGAKAIQAYRWRLPLPLGLRGRKSRAAQLLESALRVAQPAQDTPQRLPRPHTPNPERVLFLFLFLFFLPLRPWGRGQGRHRGGDITGAGAHSLSSAPHSPQPKSALEAEGQQPPARSPPPRQSLDQHGGDSDLNQQQPFEEEEEMELEKELLELERSHKVDLDIEHELEQELERELELETGLEPEPELESEPELELEPEPEPEPELEPELEPEPDPELELEPEPEPRDPEQPESRTESLQPHTPRYTSLWSVRSHSSYLSLPEEDQVSTNHRSIRVQTSNHLFWADKHIQASERSLRRAISNNIGKPTSCQDQKSDLEDACVCCIKQIENPSAQPAPPTTDSQQLSNPPPPSSSPSPGIDLADLVNFASSLAVASSSKMDLPNLEHMIKALPQKAEAPSTDPTPQLVMDQPEKENLTKDLMEKSLETEESQKAWKQEDKNVFCPYLDFSKPGIKRATIKGEVQLLQQPARSPPPKGAVKGSVPGTRKGSPLLLKIHFKVSSPTSPVK
ncbi:spermatogenesis-associated protein 32 isoform X2 [Mustela putorius furo]|uniref:Spermatogenesis-associated protein 32 isoform X2 n=1 Tax=Mustela putorius furo TaxID=9669 RepID=A0A8U0V1Y7_MUSPF|nr:spermatogenesis-associated protein 32 isoform X2 [Mustela putorius furo]